MTNDERREVAARLRTEVSEGECIDYAVFRIVHDVMGVEDAMGARAGRILADLIDPTCHIALDDWASEQCMGPMLSCDRCGAAFPPINEDYNYCPSCGARCVDNGGGHAGDN